ncbi:MogA/MoaB family molybdenum cofactor biosynthesis protein [Haloarcula marina]|uniref:MogA/MoaB family molybdenum cofactor biosynthesis protein n=1 Tax=Haloarcula marina TaxID=2961574 RepID=UPI0020B7868D|nr:molybdopterin-binding protein [Halomicroarcula marina]
MVDFQSRDTRRGVGGGTDEDDDDETDTADAAADDAAEGDEAAEEQTASETSDVVATAETTEEAETGASMPSAETGDGDTDGEQAADPLSDPFDEGSEDAATEDPTGEAESAVGRPSGETASPVDDSGDADATAESAADTGPAADTRGGPAAGSKVATADPGPTTDDAPASPQRAIDVAVVTVGTTTDRGEDPTGETVTTALESAGHSVTARERLRGDYDGVQQAVDTLVGRRDVEAVVTAGGVGIAASEVTIEAVHPLFEKALPGFGEAFRNLLFEHIGTGIVAVRATAGIAAGTPVFCLPSDAEAATLAVEEIVAAEGPELVAHLDD